MGLARSHAGIVLHLFCGTLKQGEENLALIQNYRSLLLYSNSHGEDQKFDLTLQVEKQVANNEIG